MTRLLLLGLAAALTLPAAAQTTPAPADTTAAADSVQAFVPDPTRARPLYDEALALGRANNNYEGALLKYEESLLHDPAFVPSLFGRAQSLAQLGRLEDARTAFEASVAAARAASDARVLQASERGLTAVQTAIQQRDANASATATAAARNAAVTEATTALSADPLSPEAAQQGYDALERARAAGYDPNLVALYYAKALMALGRAAEAVPYAQTALDAADPATDRSGFYIQLGLAHKGAGNLQAAREAFEEARTGSWSGWAEHYLRELDAASDATDG